VSLGGCHRSTYAFRRAAGGQEMCMEIESRGLQTFRIDQWVRRVQRVAGCGCCGVRQLRGIGLSRCSPLPLSATRPGRATRLHDRSGGGRKRLPGPCRGASHRLCTLPATAVCGARGHPAARTVSRSFVSLGPRDLRFCHDPGSVVEIAPWAMAAACRGGCLGVLPGLLRYALSGGCGRGRVPGSAEQSALCALASDSHRQRRGKLVAGRTAGQFFDFFPLVHPTHRRKERTDWSHQLPEYFT